MANTVINSSLEIWLNLLSNVVLNMCVCVGGVNGFLLPLIHMQEVYVYYVCLQIGIASPSAARRDLEYNPPILNDTLQLLI